MFRFTLILQSCILIIFQNVVFCDYNKNSVPARTSPLSLELTKNQFDNVHIRNENFPNITAELLRDLAPVKKLEIESSNVKLIEEGSFNKLTSMKKLSLKHNLLEEIKNNVFSSLRSIEELDLSDNQITVIEKRAFVYMSNLKSLKLKNNRIERLDSYWFIHVYNLEEITFENNLIKSLPADILGGGITFRSVSLIFSHNQIQELDRAAFSGIRNFNRLYLDHNAITTIPSGIFRFVEEIKELRLDHNQISCISEEVKGVRKYDFEFNPWDQECLQTVLKKMNASARYYRAPFIPRL